MLFQFKTMKEAPDYTQNKGSFKKAIKTVDYQKIGFRPKKSYGAS